jgi:hypothetical protein
MTAFRMAEGRVISTRCRIEIEQSHDSLHAHVEIDDVEIGPGDRVLVLDAPGVAPFGESASHVRPVMIVKANWFERLWAHVEGYLELTQLYEVGFSERRNA